MEVRPLPLEVVVKRSEGPDAGYDSDETDEFHDAQEMAYDGDGQPTTGGRVVSWSNTDDTEVRYRLNGDDDDVLQITYEQRSDYDVQSVDNDVDVEFCFPSFEMAKGMIARTVREASWKVTHFHSLPDWLKDNDFLKTGHRPPLRSYNACLMSIFRIHTETGNIWTHMLGCATFIAVAAYFLSRPSHEIQMQEKIVFSVFFVSAIVCLGFSSALHTVSCHSEEVVRFFSKLDYIGVSVLIVGSFIPWLFYGFYCRRWPKIVYMTIVFILGLASAIVSTFDRFARPGRRHLRAVLFTGFGLSGLIPCIHYFVTDGFWSALYETSFGWLVLMGVLYITGACLYAYRIPERFFPGKFDIWCQSHQLWHMFVVVAAFVHYHGMTSMAAVRLSAGTCDAEAALSNNLFSA